MAAVAATGLTCCGGGGGETQDYITARQFAAGKGLTLYGIPNLTFVEGYSGEAVNDDLVGVPNLALPGTGKPGAEEDDPTTPDIDEREPIPDTPLHAIGKSEIVTRKVMISGSSPHAGKTCEVTAIYTETEENIAVIELSFGTTAAEDKDFITALGVAAAAAEQNNQGGGQGTLNRATIDSLSACGVSIYLDFNTGYASTVISASGVEVRDEDGNEGFTANSVVISASSVRFAI